MLALRDRLLNMPLMSLQTGSEVGRTTSAIIDPRNLSIVAFYCEGPGIDFTPALIHTSDIREFANIGMIIDSADVIMSTEGLVRLQEIISFNFKLEDKQVVDDNGHKIGKVIDYTSDTSSFYVIKLHVKPPLLHSFSAAEIIIDRSQIKSINDKSIVVKAPAIKDRTNAAVVPSRQVENPFRKTGMQSEAMHK